MAVPFVKAFIRFYEYIDRLKEQHDSNSSIDINTILKSVILCIVLPSFSYIFFKFFREMLVVSGKWDGNMKCWCCNRSWGFGSIKLSKERLARRMHYLTKRFSKRAPYWQFIIWGRQISILIFEYSVSNVWIMFGSLLIAIIYLQLWKKFFLSMKKMWRNEEIEEFDDGDDLAMSVNEGGYALLEEEELGEGGGGSAVKEDMEDEEEEEEGGDVDENAMELTLLKQ